jgi:hypothetical protein
LLPRARCVPDRGLFGFNAPADLVSDHLVAQRRAMLVDVGGPGRAVAHPVHEFAQAGPGLGGQGVAGMPQVVKVDADEPGRFERRAPNAREVAAGLDEVNIPLVTLTLHNGRMSRWLEQRSVWQFLVIMWVITGTAALLGMATAARFSQGHLSLEVIAFGSLALAIGATLGRQMRKRSARARSNPGS